MSVRGEIYKIYFWVFLGIQKPSSYRPRLISDSFLSWILRSSMILCFVLFLSFMGTWYQIATKKNNKKNAPAKTFFWRFRLTAKLVAQCVPSFAGRGVAVELVFMRVYAVRQTRPAGPGAVSRWFLSLYLSQDSSDIKSPVFRPLNETI